MLRAKFETLTTKTVHFPGLTAESSEITVFFCCAETAEVCFMKVSSHISP